MTSTDERQVTDPLIIATAGDVERGIHRERLKRGFAETDPKVIAAVMTVVGPVLEAKDAEITHLRRTLRSAASAAENAVGERLTVLEGNTRASERRRCADYLDREGFTEAASLLRSWAIALAAVTGSGLR